MIVRSTSSSSRAHSAASSLAVRVAVAVGVGDPHDRDRRGAERLLHRPHAGEAQRAQRDAVVGDLARDRLRALRLALGQVVLADDLPGGLDRLRAAVGEEHAVEVAGRALGQRGGELDRRRVRGRPVGVERQRRELRARDRGHLLAERVADLAAEQRRQPVEVALAVGVEDVGALAPLQHQERLAVRPEGPVAGEVHQQVPVRLLLERFGAHGVGDCHAIHARPAPRGPAMGETSPLAADCPTDRQPAAEAQRAHREVQAEHDVLVVERDAERLLDPAQPQVQRLALEVQRPRRLGLAPARGQVGLERLQQRARARRARRRAAARAAPRRTPRAPACRAGRAGGRRRPGGARRASARRGSAVAAPAERRTRRSAWPAATHVSAGPADRQRGVGRARARAGRARRGRGGRRARPAPRRTRARRARAGSAGRRRAGRAARRARSRTARCAARRTAAST